MASPQKENGFIQIANDLWNELLRRDFSKRELNVILLIWRLSYGTGQKDCKIEKLNMMELAGMYKQDVKKTLTYLKGCKVLNWDEENMIFSINKDYEYWQISPNKRWDEDRYKSLIRENIQRKKVSKTLTPEKPKVSKTLTFRNGLVSKTLTTQLVKHLPAPALILTGARVSASLNTGFKDIKDKDNVVVEDTGGGVPEPTDSIHPIENGEIPPGKDAVDVIAEYFQLKKGVSPERSLQTKEYTLIKELLLQGVTLPNFKEGIDRAFESYTPSYEGDTINTFAYCKKPILKNRYESKQVDYTPEAESSGQQRKYKYGF